MSESWHDLKAQLIELQTQLAFQEDTLHALDKVVTDQQQRLDQLALTNARLEQQLSEFSGWMEEQRVEAPPPHY